MKNNFSEEEKNFIEKNVKGRTSEELTKIINERFNRNLTNKQIQQYKKTHKLRSGISTKFKKGQIAPNYKPVGSEFISTDGYTYIKINDPNTWIHKQIYVYEKNIGPVPKGYSVLFADRNKQNFNLDNLILVENKDKLVAKNKHLIYNNKELTKTGLLIAKLINKVAEKNK